MIGYSLLNPVRFKFDLGYNTEYDFDHNLPFCYFQKWQEGDIITIQVLSDVQPFIDLRDQTNLKKISSFTPEEKGSNLIGVEFQVWEFNIEDLPYEGVFYFELGFLGLNVMYPSYPFKWESFSPNTILIQYRNSYNDQDIIFDTGVEFSFRVEGTIQNFTPRSDSVIYFDQKKDPLQLSSTPYRTWSLIVGTILGIPDWSLDLLNLIMSTDTKQVDGLFFERNEGSEWEIQRIDRYALSSATIDIVQRTLQSVKVWSQDGSNVVSQNGKNIIKI